ncbi:MAG TPA: ABC transporter ATP-binding protein [Chloroflexota bacterium]|nr:ABC transporter ATP-binding protein [Chloroflexota bacterium]
MAIETDELAALAAEQELGAAPGTARAGRGLDRAVALRVLALARPHAGRLVLAGICLLFSSVAFLAVPYIIRQLTDSVFVHRDPAALNTITLTLLAVVLASAVFNYGRGYLISYAGNRIVTDLRIRLVDHLQRLSLSFYDEHRTGEIMSRVTADTTLVQTVITANLLDLAQQVFTLVAVTAIVLATDWRLALVALAVAPLLAGVAVLVGRRTRTLSRRAQEQLGEAGAVLQEALSSMRIVKAFGAEEYEIRRYTSAVTRSFGALLSAARYNSFLGAVMMTAGFGAVAVVLWYGGHEVLAHRLSPGGFISFLFYLMMLVGPLQGLAQLYSSFQQALGGATRIFELLDTAPGVVDAPDAYTLPVVQGRVEIEDLSFAYTPGGPLVLRDVNLTVEAGKTVALVGPSGAGKTTLISLLPRFYDPADGRILIDGHDITRVTQQSLRGVMATVPQEATLFAGTVRENIAYGRPGATQAEIEAAARAANAHDFIMALPHGYQATIGERGVKLSGGQRQRIAIARAILKDPRLLILDEATSALDNESEGLVQEALERLMAGRTTIVIAHRLTTVEGADTIVVLDAGRVVEQGTHAELLAARGLYHRLYTRDFAQDT